MLCAGAADTGTATICEGDGGGPLVVNGRIVGIASSRDGICDTANNSPSVFTDVATCNSCIKANSNADAGGQVPGVNRERPLPAAEAIAGASAFLASNYARCRAVGREQPMNEDGFSAEGLLRGAPPARRLQRSVRRSGREARLAGPRG